MRDDIRQDKWLHKSGKKRPHWAILTLDDLDQTIWEHSRMITRLRARFKAAKERSKDKPSQKPDDFS
jgi:hypothetical protein